MVFKADFTADLGKAPEVAAVDPKMAYYLAETLQRNAASVGQVVKAGVEGYIAIDTQKRTEELAEQMKETRSALETGMERDKEVAGEVADFEWEAQARKEMNPNMSDEDKKLITDAFKTRIDMIDQAHQQKGISFPEAVARWHTELKSAIAARPSLAAEFRQISGKWTGSSDWDNYYIKQEEAKWDASEKAKVAAIKKQQEYAHQQMVKQQDWLVKESGMSPQEAWESMQTPEGQGYISALSHYNQQAEATKRTIEENTQKGELTAQSLQASANTLMASATGEIVNKMNLSASGKGSALSRFIKPDGTIDYLAAGKDITANSALVASVKTLVAEKKQDIMQSIMQGAAGSPVDTSATLKQLDEWEKRVMGTVTATPTSAIEFLKNARESQDKDLTHIVATTNLHNNLYKSLGVDSTVVSLYNKDPKQVEAMYGKSTADLTKRFIESSKQTAAVAQEYVGPLWATMKSIGDGSINPMAEPTNQAEQDAMRMAMIESSQALANGTADPNNPTTANSLRFTLNKTKPVGATWDTLYKAITNGNYADYLSKLPEGEAKSYSDSLSRQITSYFNNYDKEPTGIKVIKNAFGGRDDMYTYEIVKGEPDQYGITTPSVRITGLTEKGNAYLDKQNPKYKTYVLDQMAQTEVEVNSAINQSLAKPYRQGVAAMAVIGNLNKVPTHAGKGASKPGYSPVHGATQDTGILPITQKQDNVPKNAPSEDKYGW